MTQTVRLKRLYQMTKPYFAKAPGEEWKIPIGDEKEPQRKWEDRALISDCLCHFKPQKQGCGYDGSVCLYWGIDSLHSQHKTGYAEEMAC